MEKAGDLCVSGMGDWLDISLGYGAEQRNFRPLVGLLETKEGESTKHRVGSTHALPVVLLLELAHFSVWPFVSPGVWEREGSNPPSPGCHCSGVRGLALETEKRRALRLESRAISGRPGSLSLTVLHAKVADLHLQHGRRTWLRFGLPLCEGHVWPAKQGNREFSRFFQH